MYGTLDNTFSRCYRFFGIDSAFVFAIVTYSLFFLLLDVLLQCTNIKKNYCLSKASLNYNIKLVYLIINKNNKNLIGYTVFDKVKIT